MSESYSGRPRMNVLDSIGTAVNRTVWMFNPLSFAVWLRFGFIAFMSVIMSGGCGGSLNLPLNLLGEYEPPIPNSAQEAIQSITENLVSIIVVGLGLLTIFALVSTIFIWIGCRGHMMLIRAVATNDPSIRNNWRATKALGSSLFKFRVGYLVVVLLAYTPLILMGTAFAMELIKTEGAPGVPYIVGIVLATLFSVLASLLLLLVDQSLKCFVTPIMYMDDIMCTEAWWRFRDIAVGNILPILGFFLLRMALYMVAGMANFFVAIFTCCIGTLPLIQQIILAPFFVFDRAYSIYALESLGPEYQIIERPDLDTPPEPEPPKYQSPPMDGSV